jgi:hypothetical protein
LPAVIPTYPVHCAYQIEGTGRVKGAAAIVVVILIEQSAKTIGMVKQVVRFPAMIRIPQDRCTRRRINSAALA